MQWKETQTISRQQCRQQIGSQQALSVHESSVCTVNRPGQAKAFEAEIRAIHW